MHAKRLSQNINRLTIEIVIVMIISLSTIRKTFLIHGSITGIKCTYMNHVI